MSAMKHYLFDIIRSNMPEDPDAWVVFDQFSMLSGKENITRDDFKNFTVSF